MRARGEIARQRPTDRGCQILHGWRCHEVDCDRTVPTSESAPAPHPPTAATPGPRRLDPHAALQPIAAARRPAAAVAVFQLAAWHPYQHMVAAGLCAARTTRTGGNCNSSHKPTGKVIALAGNAGKRLDLQHRVAHGRCALVAVADRPGDNNRAECSVAPGPAGHRGVMAGELAPQPPTCTRTTGSSPVQYTAGSRRNTAMPMACSVRGTCADCRSCSTRKRSRLPMRRDLANNGLASKQRQHPLHLFTIERLGQSPLPSHGPCS